MNRPYIICHILQSIDGKINGHFFDDRSTQELSKIYKQMSDNFHADAIVYGSKTISETCSKNNISYMDNDCDKESLDEDYINVSNDKKSVVIVDPDGTIIYDKNLLNTSRLKNKNIIIILTKKVSNVYLKHLKSLGISYIIGGKSEINLNKSVEKLKVKCGIEKLLLQGGGILNGTFMNENLVDELSLIISPVISVESGLSSLCDASEYSLNNINPIKFKLSNTKVLPQSGLWIHYVSVE